MPLRINIPPLTRGLLLLVLASTLLNSALTYRGFPLLDHEEFGLPFLSVVPRSSIKTPWAFGTATFVEQNLFSLAASMLTIYYGGRYLERAWGGPEFAKFVLFVTMIPNVLCFVVYWIWAGIEQSEMRFHNDDGTTRPYTRLDESINGALALEAAFLVAFKQLVPEHTVSLFKSAIRIRVKHFPAIFVLLNTISGPLLGTDTALFLGWFGFLTSWIYLRFYRVSPTLATTDTGDGAVIRGDASDTFAFSHFFPDVIQSAIAPVCDSIYNTLVAIRICTPFSEADLDVGNEQASARAEGGLPSLMNPSAGYGATDTISGGRREEAERRRALALRMLDARLNAAAAGRDSHAAGPSTNTAAVAAMSEGGPAPPVVEAGADKIAQA
ncbi:hypothetical protein MBLNU457_g2514t1 [Dothideomycetes sp. NU457]